MDPTTRLHALVTDAIEADGNLPLDEAALLIAAHASPDLDVDQQLGVLDQLAATAREPTLDGLLRALYRDGGFRGNRDEYYAPENSLLDRVVERRLGIPISLSVLTIEVGRRLGVPLAPVGMPGHFLVGDRVLGGVFVDCFAGGAVLTEDQCRRVFHSLHGAATPWNPAYLAEVPAMSVIHRMLNNLRAIYAQRSEPQNLVWVLTLLSAFPGRTPDDAVELAGALSAVGRYDEAARHYETAAGAVDGPAAENHRLRARRLRAFLN